MSKASDPVSVSILDRDYQFTCEPGERNALKEAAFFLDERMREIKAAGKLMSLERVAVMTALNMADELLKSRRHEEQRQDRVDRRIVRLADELEDALNGAID
ncbi:MAG: cell division protein ZapA [Xanthomonadales bacterium]|nr:cell division protein ZapA [Xanthomonadales bacterium]NIN59474.1 cell division protein ZapA [Xanthomonadales bacterium]NIN74848.1 cell division protein ZapA [Xanthomonadales bacterium]NIO14934.1 cell division protein ZapA [Xanthomonadales bacterium]NIP11867.1 cell division protein ZapA [Xanthomonadales bacterium]